MSNLDQKRQILEEYNNIGFIRYKNRAYVHKNLMLLRDYIANTLKSYVAFFKNKGYKIDKKSVDTITDFIFKAKNPQEQEEREMNILWETNTGLALLPPDTVIDTSSKFAFNYNWKSNLSSKYLLLKTYGINSKKDIENNSYGRPVEIRETKTKTSVREEKVRPKVYIDRYYYKGKQIKKENAFERVLVLKKNIEEIVYKVGRTYRTIYVNVKTDERVYKKNAFKVALKLKKGVKKIRGAYLSKKEVTYIKTKTTTIDKIEYVKVNYFAQTYRNYLPYYLFLRLAKQEDKDTGKIVDKIKFYISTYVSKEGNIKYIPSTIKNGHDIIANSDMIGNVVMPQILESKSMTDLIRADGRLREKPNTDTGFFDTPVLMLFYVGQKNLSAKKRYRRTIRDDVDVIDVYSEADTGKMRDSSSLNINRNADYLVDIKDVELKKSSKEQDEINKIEIEYNTIQRQIERLEKQIKKEQIIKNYFAERKIKKVTDRNIDKIITELNDSINKLNKQKRFITDNEIKENLLLRLETFINYRDDLETIEGYYDKKLYDNAIKEFNNDRLTLEDTLRNNIKKLQDKQKAIKKQLDKQQQTLRPIDETVDTDMIGDGELVRVHKVNLLRRYYNKIVNEINSNNNLISFKRK
ncbi:MAG: hypothetical protein IJ890_05690 [Clostridia bacterium]|nr:hypothetical protein [Clostridia bacterium]